jgi:hypothetical protein
MVAKFIFAEPDAKDSRELGSLIKLADQRGANQSRGALHKGLD